MAMGAAMSAKRSELSSEMDWSSQDSPLGGIAKRMFDLLVATLALTSALLLFFLIALLIRLIAGGPVFYKHARIGFRSKRFNCLKFRTMVVDADMRLADWLDASPEARAEFQRDKKLKNDPRIIPVIGSFLRKTSLDELPQFINVLRGEMSVVGPRPVTAAEIPDYEDRAAAYLSTRPGITGLWQVSGRNLLTFRQRVEIDLDYVQNWSLQRDIAIIRRTFGVLITGYGAY